MIWWRQATRQASPPSVPNIVHPMDAKIMRQMKSDEASKSFDVICDFAALPLAFDIVVFLVSAEAYRRRFGFITFNVIFVADKSDPLPQFHRSGNPVDLDNAETVLFNVGLNATRLFPAVKDVFYYRLRSRFVNDWDESRIGPPSFPVTFDPTHPSYVLDDYGCMAYHPRYALALLDGMNETTPLLAAPKDIASLARQWVQEVAGSNFAVTLTLRETSNVSKRNSQIENWQKLAEKFIDTPVHFIIVRDYFSPQTADRISGSNVTECPQAAESIVYRKALYEQANFNMLTNGGSAILCYLDCRVDFAAFNVGQDADSSTVDDMLNQWGLEPGAQLPLLSENEESIRRLIWNRDDLDKLVETLSDVLADQGSLDGITSH